MRSPGWLIATFCVAETLGMAAFATFPTLILEFQAEWGINNAEAGWISGIYFAGYIVAVAVLTALTDRLDPKRIYLACMALSTLSALGFAVSASGVGSASFWRLLQGLGLAGTYMPGLKALSDQLPERLQARGIAFYTSSFGIGASLSYYLSGVIGSALDWQWAFGLSALGPLTALIISAFVLESRPAPKDKLPTRLLNFRPVLVNRRVLGFTLAYTVHNLELFAFRSWIVAFLIFSQQNQPSGVLGATWSAATIAAIINLVGLPSSVLGNELASRIGRQRTAIVIMFLSTSIGFLFGFLAASPFWLVLLIAVAYMVTVTGESATLTAGVIKVAEPRYKGTTMAAYSTIGFVGSFLGPITFGLVLDVSGGETAISAWGLAFGSSALILLLGPLALLKFVGLRTTLY